MLKITSSGIPAVRAWLKSIATDAASKVSAAFAEYLVGDQTHGLKHYPVYEYVSMEKSGGWKSEKQRRYVMAKIREEQGEIDPNYEGYPRRTGELQRGWNYSAQGSRYVITNAVPYAKWVMGPGTQSRARAMGGWRTTLEAIQNNLAGAYRHARAKLGEWLRAHPRG